MRELVTGILGHDQPVQLSVEFPCLRFGRAEHRDDAGQDLDPGRIAASRGGAGLEVGVEGLAVGQRLLGGEDRFGVPGREILAVVRRPGLHEHRMTLRRARQVQRAADTEEPAGMVDGVDQVVPACMAALPSAITASSSQLSQSLRDTSTNSAARW